MAFFDELTKKAKDVAAVAADKAKDAAELTKLSVAIAGEQREIDKNYRIIGEWFVNEYEGEIPDAVRDMVEAVNASKARSRRWKPPRKPPRTSPWWKWSRRKRPAPSAAPRLTASSVPSAAPPWVSEK